MQTKILYTAKLVIVLVFCTAKVYANDQYGKTFNLGFGNSWYGTYRVPVSMLHLNYEFDVANQFTLAPFISYHIHNRGIYNNYYRYEDRRYRYYETIVPIGVKGTYYLDDAINLDNKFDLYLAGSLGFALVRNRYEYVGYDGRTRVYRNAYGGTTPLFLDAHLGFEYHINPKIGMFVDLSTTISTIGLSIKTN